MDIELLLWTFIEEKNDNFTIWHWNVKCWFSFFQFLVFSLGVYLFKQYLSQEL